MHTDPRPELRFKNLRLVGAGALASYFLHYQHLLNTYR